MCNVLVDLDDRLAARLLTRVSEAAPTGANVVVVELVRGLADESLCAHISLHQYAMTGGRTRTVDELCALAGVAGLVHDRVVALGGGLAAVLLHTTRDSSSRSIGAPPPAPR